jgi:large subunit ribosomal protein L24
MPSHVIKGDTVIITSGQHRGQTGEIMRVIPKKDQVIIKGVNLRTKNLKPTRLSPQGGVITKEAPIHISNVSPVVDGKPTRVRFEIKPDGSKVRVAVRGGKVLSVVHKARKPASPAAAAKKPGRKK